MQTICEKEFYSKYKDIFYKTSNSEFGKHSTQIPFGKSYGKNSSFTTVSLSKKSKATGNRPAKLSMQNPTNFPLTPSTSTKPECIGTTV